jgi:hypothetical protein
MGRPPWAICVASCLDAVIGVALAFGGAWWILLAASAVLDPHHLWSGILLIGGLWGLGGVAVGGAVACAGVALWKGAAWARWPTALLALGLVPGGILLAVWTGQGGLLVLVPAGPLVALGLFLPAARRYVGTAAAEEPGA